MATRMQQRRGTAAQWISTNNGDGPILNAGEIGFESDSGKFKIGDGANHWADLPYFADVDTLGTALDGDFVEITDIGAVSGVAGLDANKNLLVPGASIIVEGTTDNTFETTLTVTDPTVDRTITFPNADGTVVLDTTLDEMAQDAVNTAIVAGTGLDKTYDDGANTITLDIDSTVTTNSGSQTLTNKTIALGNNTVSGTTAEFNSALTDSNFVTTGDTGTVTSTMIADGTIVDGDINASAGIALSKLATDPLARANHTGSQTASTISDFDTQVRLSRLDQMAAPTASVSLNSQKITSLATPEASTDAATKAYVDAVAEGLHIHPSCEAATSANVDISTELEAGDVVDGVTLVAGNRVLVKSQTNAAQNGIYVVQASGAALRASDFNEPQEVDGGDFVFVTGGTLYDNTGWVQTTTNVVTIGTDPIVFTQFSGAGTYQAGTGLTLTGNTFSINTSTTVDTSTAQTLTNKTLSSPTVTGTLTAGGGTGTNGQFLQSTSTGIQWATVSSPADATPTISGKIHGTSSSSNTNTSIGYSALNALTIGSENVAIGESSMLFNENGGFNTAVGRNSLRANISGGSNIAVGQNALYNNTTGGSNTAIGVWALYANTGSSESTAVGRDSLRSNTTGSGNTAVGRSSLRANTSGYNNVSVGLNAMRFNQSGYLNTAIGDSALSQGTYGTFNTAIGVLAGEYLDGSNNTLIGYNAAASSSTVSNEITLGNSSITSFRIPGLGIDLRTNIEVMTIMGAL